ncbi:MAG: hypothetical protein CL687_03300 [Candidatus Pelagibacter sp.]|nr:hypothetical protein [Candidatus Pelagibacter sp.]
MNLIAIIQSRMSSDRYPGKMLAPFLGKPIFNHVVERIRETKINLPIILATSKEVTDDPLVLYAKHLGLEVVRGDLNDVVGRFNLTLRKYKCDAFFRVCGDSPLLYSSLFDTAASIFEKTNFDLITNVFPRTFPPGMSIELIKTKTFLDKENKIINKYDREHITQFFYRNSKEFRIFNIKCSKPISSNLKLSLDELQDLKTLELWYSKTNKNYENLFPIEKK